MIDMQIQQNIQTLRQTLQRALSDKPDDLLAAEGVLDAMWLEAEQINIDLRRLKMFEQAIEEALNDR